MADIETVRAYFREATGKAQEEEWKDRRDQMGGIRRSLANLASGSSFDRGNLDWRRQERAESWLGENIFDGSAGTDFPVHDLAFMVDRSMGQTRFSYQFLFSGKRVDEEGELRVMLQSSTLALQRIRGNAPLLMVAGGRGIVGIPYPNEVPIKARITGIYGYSASDTVGIWRPSLTEQPIIYSQPAGGEIRFTGLSRS